MRYETLEGRKPVDVSASNLGFDILSTESIYAVRHIEVKGLSGQSDVILTSNELKVAKQHKDSYFVYIVENCSRRDKQQLYIFRDFSDYNLVEEVVDYKIDSEEQKKADVVCYL